MARHRRGGGGHENPCLVFGLLLRAEEPSWPISPPPPACSLSSPDFLKFPISAPTPFPWQAGTEPRPCVFVIYYLWYLQGRDKAVLSLIMTGPCFFFGLCKEGSIFFHHGGNLSSHMGPIRSKGERDIHTPFQWCRYTMVASDIALKENMELRA